MNDPLSLESRIPALLLKSPWRLLIGVLLMVILGAVGLTRITVQSNYQIYFDDDNPELLALEAMEKRFVKNRFAFLVIAPRTGEIFNAETLEIIAEATELSWQIPAVTRVDSMTNFQWSESVDGDFVVTDLYEAGGEPDSSALARLRDIALSQPRLVEALVAADGKAAGINMQMTLSEDNTAAETRLIASKCRELAAKLKAQYPDHEFRLTGQIFLDRALPEATIGDIAVLYPVAVILMMAALGALLNSLVLTILTLVIILLSIVTTIGLGAFAGIALNPAAVQAPVMILCMAIANSVHVLEGFVHALRSGMAQREAIAESLRINIQPVILANATTAIGFLSLNLSEVPPFRDLGNLVSIGVMLSAFMTLTVLPAALILLPIRLPATKNDDHSGMARLGDWVVVRHKLLLIGGLLIASILIAFVPRNDLNDVFSKWFDESFEFRRNTDYLEERLTGFYAIDYVLDTGETNGIAQPQFLDTVAEFTSWLRARPEIRSVSSISDTLAHVNQVMNDGDPAFYRVPQSSELAAQYLLFYEMSLPYGLDLNNEINIDKSAIRLVARADSMATSQMLALEEDIQAWLAREAPEVMGGGTGTALMFSHIGERNIKSMLLATTIALLLISVMLMAAFRSLRFGLVSLIPNLLPAAAAFGIWGIFVGEVGLGLSIVTGITLGIVVDDTVHFMSKYLRARREQGLSAPDAVRYAFHTVGRALMVTSTVLVIGFLVVASSHYLVNAQLGLLTALVVALALAADFLILPGLLITADRFRAHQQANRETG